MTRSAVIVGINDYDHQPRLDDCIADATAIAKMLATNHDGSDNFDCEILVSDSARVTRPILRAAATRLFAKPSADIALFYFAGHGSRAPQGSCLITQEGEEFDQGIPMGEIVDLANGSDAKDKIIILDCCASGAIDQMFGSALPVTLGRGVSVLAACRDVEKATEKGGHGAFTAAVLAGLNGDAADVIGKVTVASIYAYVDETFSEGEQRPLLKTSIESLVPLRMARGAIDPKTLNEELLRLFPTADHELHLDATYEPTEQPNHPEHEAAFSTLQRLRGARLVVPNGTEHMYYAAIENRSCSLTPLGRFYWRMAAQGKL